MPANAESPHKCDDNSKDVMLEVVAARTVVPQRLVFADLTRHRSDHEAQGQDEYRAKDRSETQQHPEEDEHPSGDRLDGLEIFLTSTTGWHRRYVCVDVWR